MPADFRFAISNGIFGEMPLPEVCREVRQAGYDGIELTPHLFTERNLEPSEVRERITDAGLGFVGFHWLLVSPPGIHITSEDQTVVRRGWEHVRRMVDLCAEMAGSTVVIGSPKQRASRGGGDCSRARDVFVHELAHLAPFAESRGVLVLVEAIPARETDVVNRIGEAVAIARQIGSPAIQTMFDVHNAADETEPDPDLIRRFSPYIRHIHMNEKNGAEPGMGNYDFEALMQALRDVQYDGWVSVEAFDFSRTGPDIAAGALKRLRTAAEN